MATPLLELDQLTCGYGEIEAVSALSLAVAPGEIFALLGPNGAGKTSTIMAIMGHVAVTRGAIRFDGRDLTPLPAVARPRLGIALVPEGRRLFPDLTVEETLTVGGYSRALAGDRRNRDRVYALFPRLAERRGQLAGSLSGGEQQMLALGRALMVEPTLLLIDELSLGLMPKMVDLCVAALRALNRDGLTILLVEQNTARALALADRVCVLASGRAVFHGSAAEARQDDNLFVRYFGLPA
jgi:branched-chain amino acid transport system ATP-binding protein